MSDYMDSPEHRRCRYCDGETDCIVPKRADLTVAKDCPLEDRESMPDLPTEAEVASLRDALTGTREVPDARVSAELLRRLISLVEAWAPIVEERAERGEDGYCHCPTGTRGKEHFVACEIETAHEWRRWKGEADVPV